MIGDVGKFDEIVKFCDEFLLYKDGNCSGESIGEGLSLLAAKLEQKVE